VAREVYTTSRRERNVSTVLTGQRLGIGEVGEEIWLVTFIDYGRVAGRGAPNRRRTWLDLYP